MGRQHPSGPRSASRKRSGNSAVGRPSGCGPVESTRVFVLHRTPKAPDTEEAAAAWLVRLDADTSAATLASWQQWLREDTGHHAAFVRVEQGWRRSECLRSLRPLDGAVKLDLMDGFPGVEPASQRTRMGWRARYATLAVALGAGALASLLVLAGWHLFTSQ